MTDSSFGFPAEPLRPMTERMLADRMIGIRLLLDKVDPGDAAESGLDEAYRALSLLQATHPLEVNRLISAPMTGAWLVHAMRRAVTMAEGSPTPLWADLGYLGWLTLAAAIQTNHQHTINVVVRHGIVMVPEAGSARLALPDVHTRCEAHWTASGTLIFTTDDSAIAITDIHDEHNPAWLPLRAMHSEPGAPRVLLDDLDPFRDPPSSFPLPLPRLTAHETSWWNSSFAGALSLLDRDYPRYASAIREGLHTIVPMSATPTSSGRSTTSKYAYGCVYSTAPMDRCRFAETLIHEFQHSKLALVADRTPLCASDPEARYYAPWRDDPRPIYGVLHGIYAFTGVADFWRKHRFRDCHRGDEAEMEFARWCLMLAVAVQEANASALLTSAGTQLIETTTAELDRWEDEHVPDHVRSAAADFVFAHRTFWRVRNLRLTAPAIGELTRAWSTAGARPARIATAVTVDQQAVPESHRKMFEPTDLGVLTADAAESMLNTDPDDPRLCANLILARRRQTDQPQSTILDQRPEVVAELYRAIRTTFDDHPPIEDLVNWLS